MHKLARNNKAVNYLPAEVDVLSRYLRVLPMRSKSTGNGSNIQEIDCREKTAENLAR